MKSKGFLFSFANHLVPRFPPLPQSHHPTAQTRLPLEINDSSRSTSFEALQSLVLQLMILVDDAGGAFPSINHSPWFGVTLADFVMPFFLFGVGVSVSLVFKRLPSKRTATKKVVLRSIKLFLLGVLLQGGYFHGRDNLTYGVDVAKIRWCGVLQRISIGYLLASISEIWFVKNIMIDSPKAFVKKYYIQGLISIILCSVYILLLYGLYVPNWAFSNSKTDISTASDIQIVHVQCEVRGSLEPPCNAVGFLDRMFLGDSHLYPHPVYRRTKECSINSPDYGPLPPNSPDWCEAPFDPEGILSSLLASITCFLGLHFGHITLHFTGHKHKIFQWLLFSIALVVLGYALKALGIPFSKPLYTLSYTCLTAGASGLCLTLIYYIVDVKHFRKPAMLLQWMGMNALVIYALAACEIFPAALQGFYWRSPENNLVDGSAALLEAFVQSREWGTLLFVILEILFWGLFAAYLHMQGVYFKL